MHPDQGHQSCQNQRIDSGVCIGTFCTVPPQELLCHSPIGYGWLLFDSFFGQNIPKPNISFLREIFHFHGRKWYIFVCCCLLLLNRPFLIDCCVFRWWNPPLKLVLGSVLEQTSLAHLDQLGAPFFLTLWPGHSEDVDTIPTPARPPLIDCYICGRVQAVGGGSRVMLSPSTITASATSMIFGLLRRWFHPVGRNNQPELDPHR